MSMIRPWHALAVAALMYGTGFGIGQVAFGRDTGPGPQAVSEVCDLAAQKPPDGQEAAAARAMAAVAPDEIRRDLERLAQWFDEIEALPREEEQVGAALQLTADPEYQQVERRLNAFFTDVCGIDFDEDPAQADPAPFEPDQDFQFDEFDPEWATTMGVPWSLVESMVQGLLQDGWQEISTDERDGRTFLRIVANLTPDEAVAACGEISAFLAHHSMADGTATLRVLDDRDRLLVENDRIQPGDPGICRRA